MALLNRKADSIESLDLAIVRESDITELDDPVSKNQVFSVWLVHDLLLLFKQLQQLLRINQVLERRWRLQSAINSCPPQADERCTHGIQLAIDHT